MDDARNRRSECFENYDIVEYIGIYLQVLRPKSRVCSLSMIRNMCFLLKYDS